MLHFPVMTAELGILVVSIRHLIEAELYDPSTHEQGASCGAERS